MKSILTITNFGVIVRKCRLKIIGSDFVQYIFWIYINMYFSLVYNIFFYMVIFQIILNKKPWNWISIELLKVGLPMPLYCLNLRTFSVNCIYQYRFIVIIAFIVTLWPCYYDLYIQANLFKTNDTTIIGFICILHIVSCDCLSMKIFTIFKSH